MHLEALLFKISINIDCWQLNGSHTIDTRTVYSGTTAEADKKEDPEEENTKQVLKGSFQSSTFDHFSIAQDLANYRH